MNTDRGLEQINTITEKILQGAFAISNTLGCGYLEKVYENALALELMHLGLKVVRQHPIKIRYRNHIVGEYVADLIVEDFVLVELKAIPLLDPIHKAQCINYLAATGLPICLLLNFGRPKVDVCRLLGKNP
jgi:GxxExxY protein